MKSIMEPKGCKTCYACGREGIDLEEHHIFYGTANRRLSEKYGLKVHLCIPCHRGSRTGVHEGNAELDHKLKIVAQKTFEQKYSHEKFMEVFGKNYL